MMKIAVTLASGQLGRAIVAEFKRVFGSGNIIGVVRTSEKAFDLGIEIRKGDYDEPADFIKAFKDIDVVVVISSISHPKERIQQHRNVIEGAKVNHVKKFIYNSIYGNAGKCSFDAIINSNRQTEEDIRNSGLNYVIGRNGLYIDADLEYIEEYKKIGKISNCAGDGKCPYTSREELAVAYANIVKDNSLNGHILNLCGKAVTQMELTNAINSAYGLDLFYESMSVEKYINDRKAAHGEFFGEIIGGIYQGILEGAFDVKSDYKKAAGRAHKSLLEMIESFKDK